MKLKQIRNKMLRKIVNAKGVAKIHSPRFGTAHQKIWTRLKSTGVIPFEEIQTVDLMPYFQKHGSFQKIAYVYKDIYNDLDSPKVFKHMSLQGEQVWIMDPEDIRAVYAVEGKLPSGTPTSSTWPLAKVFQENTEKDPKWKLAASLAVDGEQWREARDILGPGLMTEQAATYLPNINESARAAVAFAPEYADDMNTFTRNAAFDMFTNLAIGLNPHAADKNSKHPLLQMIEASESSMAAAVALAYSPPGTVPEKETLDLIRAGLEKVEEVSKPFIEELTRDKDRPCYLNHIMDERGLSKDEAATLMGPLLSAGIGTTSGVLAFLLVNLAENPEVQDALYDEILQELGPDGDYSKQAKLPLLKASIRESHRHTPPGMFMTTRRLAQDIVLPSGHSIPANTMLALSPYYVNRDPKYVENPGKYDPWRFMDEEKKKRKGQGCPIDSGLSAHPFGMGARSCLGRRAAELEIRALTVKLVQAYRFECDPPNQEWVTMQFLVAQPSPFPKLKFTKR